MEFNLPKTLTEMYSILNDLFYYYRIKRQGYEEITMKELNLPELEFTPLTVEELTEKAEKLVAEEHAREIESKKLDLTAKIKAIEVKKENLQIGAEQNVAKVNALYEGSQEKLSNTCINNGLINSTFYTDKSIALEEEKNQQINKINQNLTNETANLNAEKIALEEQLSQVEEYYSSFHQKAVDAKVIELTEEQDKTIMEVFRYNNGLEEKKQRYKNTLLRQNAELNLKFIEITSGEFSKDQLVEMGYYDDVIRCVCGYYDTLDSTTAYRNISKDKKVPIYLDEYYSNIVYMYGVQSGLIS